MRLEISSPHAVEVPAPMRVEVNENSLPDGPLRLIPADGGQPLLAQKARDKVSVLVQHLAANTAWQYEVEEAPHLSGVELSSTESTLALGLPEGEFGVYHFEARAPRPYLWPLLGPGGHRVTRNFPMEEVPHEELDHKHHRSLWTAFDEVSGSDNWSESPPHGFTRHEKLLHCEQGVVCGGFTAQSLWTSESETPILREVRALQLYNCGPDFRLFDYNITLRADFDDVTFGDTKEGGLLAVRVASSMDGARGGTIENSEGGRGEAECWGKKAAWCDYSGHTEGEVLGVAILDHPQNPDFPTRWHVRDYGLFAANPFSTAAFREGEATPFRLTKGNSVTFRYRVLLHHGRADEGRVSEFHRAFAEPPTVRVLT